MLPYDLGIAYFFSFHLSAASFYFRRHIRLCGPKYLIHRRYAILMYVHNTDRRECYTPTNNFIAVMFIAFERLIVFIVKVTKQS